MDDKVRDIIEGITEYYSTPVRLGSRCEANVFYRVEDLSVDEIESCARFITDRVIKVCQPELPQILIYLPGSVTGLALELGRELAPRGETLEVINLNQLDGGNGIAARIKGTSILLVNDVITTARSCLDAHTKITLMGGTVLCWAALIDRTFGPGPVPVVASFTGEPVTLLTDLP